MNDAPGGNVVLVTGGANGIGRGLVEHFLRRGWRVAAGDVDAAGLAGIAGRLGSTGRLATLEMDVSDDSSVRRAVESVVDRWGRLDGLVNNAGLADPGRTPPERLPLEQWNRVLAVNLTGAFLAAKRAAPHLRARRGAIVNIASTRALQSEPNTEAYAASKGGLLALTHALAMSLGPEVRVNAISPGWIDVSGWQSAERSRKVELRPEDHAQHPAGRVGRPEDIAELSEFLLDGARSGFITGQNVVADGGMTTKMIYAP